MKNTRCVFFQAELVAPKVKMSKHAFLGPVHTGCGSTFARFARNCKSFGVACVQAVWTLPLNTVCSIICVCLLRGVPHPVWTGPKAGITSSILLWLPRKKIPQSFHKTETGSIFWMNHSIFLPSKQRKSPSVIRLLKSDRLFLVTTMKVIEFTQPLQFWPTFGIKTCTKSSLYVVYIDHEPLEPRAWLVFGSNSSFCQVLVLHSSRSWICKLLHWIYAILEATSAYHLSGDSASLDHITRSIWETRRWYFCEGRGCYSWQWQWRRQRRLQSLHWSNTAENRQQLSVSSCAKSIYGLST